MRTLRSGRGNFGLDALTKAQRDSVLDALIAARYERGVRELWEKAALKHPDADAHTAAEDAWDAYCSDPENMLPRVGQSKEQAKRLGEQALKETCTDKTRKMTPEDLRNIAFLVAHEHTRKKQHGTEDGRDGIAGGRGQEADGQNLFAEATRLYREQRGMLENAPVELTYNDTLERYVLAKQAQVARIEDKLERLIENQTAALQRPSPRLWNKGAWQKGQAQKRGRIASLNRRLGIVRKIEDGMGLFRPRIEELATRKMRAEHPGLAVEWDAAREAQRRQQEQEQQERLAREKESQKRHQAEGQRAGRKVSLATLMRSVAGQ